MSKSIPLYSGASPAQVAADLAPLVDFQAEGLPPDELAALVSDCLRPHLMRYDQPRFQSMFNAFPPAEAKLGAQVMLDYNQGVTNWQVSPGGAMLEELCGQALCRLFGLGAEAEATFMYSGTYANQQALYLALHRYAEQQGFDLAQQGIAGFDRPERLAVLISQDAHFSLKHAVRMLGLGEQSLVLLPVDANRRVELAALRQVVAEIQGTRDIVCMVATAGTTSTGAVDPIEPMADLCAKTRAWLHVDGAYGYAYKLVPGWAHLFAADERADSITWDPHKQMGVPIPNSILFVRQRADFAWMALHSSYFNRPEAVEPNPGLKSPPSTRPMSALPLVTLLRGQGLEWIVEGLHAPLRAIRALADYLRDQPDVELGHQPDTGILCFRLRPEGVPLEKLNALQRHLYDQVMASGERAISITTLAGNTMLRLVVVSPQTTFEDLRETISHCRKAACALSSACCRSSIKSSPSSIPTE
jgi:L-2,4-diaminobutyrate decarboxylase